MLSARLVPAVIGLWEGAAGVAFTVVRAGRMGGRTGILAPTQGGALRRRRSGDWRGAGWARGPLGTTLTLGAAWMAAGTGAGADQGK